jgi:hypothetical protein
MSERSKRLIHEPFGDGIISAIDFSMDIEKIRDPKGDRVKVTINEVSALQSLVTKVPCPRGSQAKRFRENQPDPPMNKKTTTTTHPFQSPLAAGALVLATTAFVCGQTPPTPPPAEPAPAAEAAPAGLQEQVDHTIKEAFTKGKFSLNARLRYEYADRSGLAESHALTIRPRFGFTTAPVYGFQGMLEGEHISSILSYDRYNAAGSNRQPGRTVIADPETTELNQAWLSYSNWDSVLKGGRQRIVLDNHRFVGDVGWRQNMQTYDAVSFQNKSIPDLTFFYSYIWEVNRVFGDVAGLPPGNRDFDSDSHLFNISYAGLPLGKLTGYAYLLDFDNSPDNSTATFGGQFAGAHTWDQERNGRINYRAEFAWQTDYQSSRRDYATEYYNFEVSGDYDRFTLGAGYEVLGSDNGQGFKTPLATLHAFNGWADVFLATPPQGLRDLYAFAGVKLPANIPLRVIYHKFDAESGGGDFGQEWNVIVSRQFGKYFTGLLKYARYDGKDAPFRFDLDRFWAQVEFNY